MRLNNIYVPFQINTYQGVFRAIANRVQSNNITRDGFAICTCNSNQYLYENVNDILLAKKTFTWWSTNVSNSSNWVQIDLGSLRVDIEGYSIHTNYDDVLANWEVWGSPDGKSWSILHNAEYTEEPPYNKMMFLNYETEKMRIRSILVNTTSVRYGSGARLAIYDFDVFGKLIVPKCFIQTSIHFHVPRLLYAHIIFLF